MKKKNVYVYLLLLILVVIAGTFCYYRFFVKTPEEIKGGTLVYERSIVHSDREEC